LIVAVAFALQEPGLAVAAIAGSAVLPTTQLQPADPSQLPDHPELLDIPLDNVTVREMYRGTNGRLVIHIQDAHANFSGQKNLARLLENLLKRYEIPLIFVEGASKEVTLDALKQLPEDWPRAARRFLQDGLISGEEYLNLSSDLKMNLVGIEDADLYDKNLEAYAALKDQRAQALAYLRKARIAIERLKVKLYPQEILDLERVPAGSDEGFLSRMDRLTGLSGFDDLPQTSKLAGLRADEARIDFNLANREQAELLSLARAHGAADEIDGLIRASAKLTSSQIFRYMALGRILAAASGAGVDTDRFVELKKYHAYLSDFTKLNMDELLHELEVLEERVYTQHLSDDGTKTLHAVDRFLKLLQSAYEIRMNSGDSARLDASMSDFGTESWQAFLNGKLDLFNFHADFVGYQSVLDDSRALIKRFYSSVAKRDDAFVSNARQVMQARGQSCAFLIAGGYHTENLTKLLRAEGTSYIVLAPLVTEETDQAKYEKLLLASLPQTNKDTSKPHVDALRWKALAEDGGGNVRFAQLYPSGDAPMIDNDAQFVSALNLLTTAGARVISPYAQKTGKLNPVESDLRDILTNHFTSSGLSPADAQTVANALARMPAPTIDLLVSWEVLLPQEAVLSFLHCPDAGQIARQ